MGRKVKFRIQFYKKNNSMKILHIINDLGSGGTERNLINYTNNDKKNIHIICSSSSNKFYETNNVRLYLTKKKFNYLNIINNFLFIQKTIKNENPDILSFWMYRSCIFSIFIKIFFNQKILWNLRNGGDLNFFNIKNKIEYYFICLFSYIIPDTTIFNSYTSVKNHQSNGYSKKKNFVVFNGFNVKKKNFSRSHKKLFNICMVARFNYFKNHKLLFKSLSKLNTNINYKLYLIGKNVDNKNHNLTNLIKYYKLKKKIILLGEKKKIFKILNKIDLHVLVSNNESFPNVVAESAYYSKISIASDVGDVKSIIGKKFIFKNESHAIKNKIEYFWKLKLNKPKFFEKLSKLQSYKIKKNYNLSKMILSFNKIYEKI